MNSTLASSPALAAPRTPTLDEVSQAIKDGQPPTWGDRDWTVGIKASVAKLGIMAGWKVCTSSVNGIDRECEWLFDQTWFHNGNGMLREVGLVLESEWGNFQEVRYDFEKLLVARAPMKVMIYCDEKLDCAESFENLGLGMRHYKHQDASERFLVACWRGAAKRFDFRRFAGDGAPLP
ncbi:MAG TPA: hypothetical protein VG734_14510 [Lacunisphaera sp.]|nr:hypothetical protein [Lacunisphaera sp.]